MYIFLLLNYYYIQKEIKGLILISGIGTLKSLGRP